MPKAKTPRTKPNFGSMSQTDVPHGRNGKHRGIVAKILSDLENLAPGRAVKIPLTALTDSKENVRSALNRVTRTRGLNVSTSSDEENFYVWMENNGNGQRKL